MSDNRQICRGNPPSAVDYELNYYFDASGNFVDDMMVQLDMGESGETGNIIETGELVGTYTREYK